MKIILIRHLPTPWNENNKLQGSQDISISRVSSNDMALIKKNLEIVNQLEKEPLVVTSQLKRTKETAAKYGFIDNIVVEPLINEFNFGLWEGAKKSKFMEMYGHDWIHNPYEIHLGESVIDLEKRLQKFIEKYSHHTSIICFSHGAIIRGLVSLNKNGNLNELNKVEIKNNQLVLLEF